MDLLLTCQLPFHLFFSQNASNQERCLLNSSTSLDVLIDALSPRYVYSSSGALANHQKLEPFLNNKGFLTRAISLGDMPQAKDAKKGGPAYIQAIEISPISQIAEKIKDETKKESGITYNEDPYKEYLNGESLEQKLESM